MRIGLAAATLAMALLLIGTPVGPAIGQGPAPAGGAAPGASDLTVPRPLPLVDGEPAPLPERGARAVPGAAGGPLRAERPAATEPDTYTLQVAAFRAAGAARRFAAKLVSRGYAASVVSADLGTSGRGVWHRVRVGRFGTREAAEAVASRLMAAEGLVAQVLREAAPSPDAARGVDRPGVER